MIAAAEEEADKSAQRSFTYANEVEKIHASLYEEALENLEVGALDADYYVCSVCGYTCADNVPDTCPVCGSAAKAFCKID
ncbi:MAG: rubredoxin-like domain-containing protein, partial [Syntrophobacteraceae bacterium]